MLNLLDIAPSNWSGKGAIVNREELNSKQFIIRGFDDAAAPSNGVIADVPMGQAFDQGYFVKDFMLPADFDISIKGMKLFGFGRKVDSSGTGGNRTELGTKAFTYRTMLMHGGRLKNGRNADDHLLLSHYFYGPHDKDRGINSDLPPKAGRYGHEDKLPVKIFPGTRYQIVTYFKLNSFKNGVFQTDGVLKTWVDGELVYSREDIVWRFSKDLLVDKALFHCFTGGGGKDWSPAKQTYVMLNEWRYQKEDPFAPSLPLPSPVVPDQEKVKLVVGGNKALRITTEGSPIEHIIKARNETAMEVQVVDA